LECDPKVMRVYHFVSRDYGLDDIRKRRIKIATIADVNDPFELVPSSSDKIVRQRFRIWREQFDQLYGMLCFKARLAFRTYTVTRQLNPALWN
jgi:hypothetical protein